MVIFFGQEIEGNIILDAGESLHLSKVLRIEVGEKVQVLDGKGNKYDCIVERSHPKQSMLKVIKRVHIAENPSKMSIAIAPTKGNDRFDWFLEKSVELGVRKIYPLKTRRMEKIKFNKERSEKILIAGMKQSGNMFLPEIEELVSLSEVLKKEEGAKIGIGYCGDSEKVDLGEFCGDGSARYLFFIGPEGDFTEEEVAEVVSKGGQIVSLGENRLRTETAAIHVLSWYYGVLSNK